MVLTAMKRSSLAGGASDGFSLDTHWPSGQLAPSVVTPEADRERLPLMHYNWSLCPPSSGTSGTAATPKQAALVAGNNAVTSSKGAMLTNIDAMVVADDRGQEQSIQLQPSVPDIAQVVTKLSSSSSPSAPYPPHPRKKHKARSAKKKRKVSSERGLPTGVYKARSGSKFELKASIHWRGKTRHIGTFDTPEARPSHGSWDHSTVISRHGQSSQSCRRRI